jgi:hypothetical protein
MQGRLRYVIREEVAMHERVYMIMALGLFLGCAGGGGAGTGGAAGKSGGASGSSSAPGGTSGAAGGGPACDTIRDSACDSCEVAQCEEAYCKCAASKPCTELLACYAMNMMQPPPPAWLEYCNFKFGSSISAAGMLSACSGQKCGSDCKRPVTDKCGACLYKSCPMEVNSCFGDSSCVKFITCYQMCNGDAGCQNNCGIEHEIGKDKALAVAACQKAECEAECPIN